MNDATVIGVTDRVAAYVREVRAELADLPMEDVDDLTGGMEADLTELAAESGGDLIGRLGSPSLYAAELRAAAGLPERVAGSARRRPMTEALTHARDSFTMLAEQRPWLRAVMAFLVTLRPAWWLLRGYVAAWALWRLLGGGSGGIRPRSFLQVVMALVAIVVSVQLGRGWLRQRAGLRPLLVLANSALVIATLVASVSVDVNYDVSSSNSTPSGVSLDGAPVANIYAYDADGKRITGVRLFDQAGRPLDGAQNSVDANGSPLGLDGNGNPLGVVRDSSGAPLLNVYPRSVVGSDPWQVSDPANPQAQPLPWTPPVSIVPLASSATPTPTPTGTPTGTPTPANAATAPTSEPVQPKPAPPTRTSGPSPSVTRSGR